LRSLEIFVNKKILSGKISIIVGKARTMISIKILSIKSFKRLIHLNSKGNKLAATMI
jgi:hypothetical protein